LGADHYTSKIIHLSEVQFLEQVRQNQGIIYKLVSLYANDPEEKKDLYQEVLLHAWKGWPSFRKEAKFSTWLYRICLNTIFTHKRKKHPLDYKDSLEEISPVIPNSSVQKENTLRLQQAIRHLSETDRAIISMNLDGYENAEIGEMLGISSNHVAVKLHRIKEQLSNLLKQ
jgi:RNA polymerase sigma-70 factor (ECF subfamily)